MAPLPAGEPGVPVARDGAGQGTPQPHRGVAVRRRLKAAAAVGLPALIALRLATAEPEVVGIDAVDETVRVWLACVVLFTVCGFGVVRLWLPEPLRGHELLWVMPAGAAAVCFVMTPLGFAAVPFWLNLPLTLAAFLALDVHAVRTRGWPPRPAGGWRSVLWPLYVGLLIAAIAMIPMFRSGFATVVGQGQDAHMAAGSAELLRHEPPLGSDVTLPIDSWWPTWRSKQAIYYGFAAVTTLTGLETYEALSGLASILLALGAVGLFLVARELLGATVGTAVVAMGIAALSRMFLHVGMHPYFNQVWGLMALPFCIVLAWIAVRQPSRRAISMLALLLALEAFAYPVALPIALLALLAFWWFDRRERAARGEEVFRFEWRAWLRRLRAQPRKVRWPLYVVGFFLLVPAWGVFEKITGATQVAISPNQPLDLWGGDVTDYFPERQFFAIALKQGWWVALLIAAYFAVRELRRLSKPLAAGLLAVFLAGAVLALEMRFRDFGWYFHFKILGFVAPLFIVVAVVGIRRAGRFGAVLLTIWVFWGVLEARDEVTTTFDELPVTMLDLRAWTDVVPASASIRLDVDPDKQPWPAYLLHEHPLCSQRPLHNTAYPHVQVSRKADYVLARRLVRPFDADGESLVSNREFALFKLRTDLPGEDRCSQEMVQTVTRVQLGANGL